MKELKIGEETYKVLESIDEINYRRSVVFNEWSILVFEQQNHSLFAMVKDRIIQHFNNGEYWQALNEIINSDFVKTLQKPDMDAMGKCFALICLKEEEADLENQGNTKFLDDKYVKRKIDTWVKAGLSRGEMQTYFENFLKASPTNYVQYLEMLKMMTRLSETLTESE